MISRFMSVSETGAGTGTVIKVSSRTHRKKESGGVGAVCRSRRRSNSR